ncbi:hypothetical protein TNCT_160211 [Trichonephila clavata]|uniref:Uncharacterized protein n=1 Tax=Trichonephila clavata TaxID=2740835 RepID=A0A8X6KBJ8_TRICU|nr:hypothetical protein TNCT_160211 [Trichonephila clavata]
MYMDLENMLNFIDGYYFTSENEKEQYASKLVTLLADGELNENLTRIEADRKNIFTNRISQRFAIPINNDTPFTPVKGRKNNRKSPTPPPEIANKKPRITATETSNKFNNLRIDDPPTPREEEKNEDVIPPLPPKTFEAPRFRPPPPITIDNVSNSAAFLKKLQTMTKEDFMRRVIGKGLRVYPKTSSLPYYTQLHRQGEVGDVHLSIE